jgi:hypothetical protein
MRQRPRNLEPSSATAGESPASTAAERLYTAWQALLLDIRIKDAVNDAEINHQFFGNTSIEIDVLQD